MRLIGKRRTTHFVVFNRGKQGTTVHTVIRLPIFRYAKTAQTACWGLPPIPRQRALKTRGLTDLLTASGRTRSRPVRGDEKAPLNIFRGLGFSTQQAFCRSVYTLVLLATIVLNGIGIPAERENNPDMRRGSVSRRGCHAER